jgi:sterol desaturase/sphingolipid hydroxylase (fatty acid hydroxylase superfamily)
MIISYKSFNIFIYVNLFLLSLSYLTHFYNYYIITSFVRNCALTLFIYHGTKNKKEISKQPKKSYYTQDYLYLVSSSVLQSSSELFIKVGFNVNGLFLLRLLLFEILLDLFHYTFHRFSHVQFYKFHKTHHHHNHPSVLNTFYHHPVDLILLECIPTLISFYLIPFSKLETSIVLVYKSFIEISGHSGKQVKSGSFPLCIWLPKFLGISLYTQNHDKHHSDNNCNYSKRFSLWDKIFGTFKD